MTASPSFQQADILDLPFATASFDHVFICFVLEHLSHPAAALAPILGLLKPGGTLTVIEGDHGSTYFHPDSPPRTPPFNARSCCKHRQAGMRSSGGRSIH